MTDGCKIVMDAWTLITEMGVSFKSAVGKNDG